MCVLKARNSTSFFLKNLSGIKNVLTTFLILDKIFSKTDLLEYILTGPNF